MKPELSHSRRQVIAERLISGEPVVAATLAVEFDVSEDAIRRDLRALASEGICRRVYGGALPVIRPSKPISVRINADWKRKRQLARAAATLIRPGEVVFIDCSSANLIIVDCLPKDHRLTIVTNSVDIASAVAKKGGVNLIVIGGEIDLAVGGAVDGTALSAVQEMVFDLAFVGVCAVSTHYGVSAHGHADAAFKRALIRQSRRTALLTLTDKFQEEAPYKVGGASDFDYVILEPDTSEEHFTSLVDAGYAPIRAGEYNENTETALEVELNA